MITVRPGLAGPFICSFVYIYIEYNILSLSNITNSIMLFSDHKFALCFKHYLRIVLKVAAAGGLGQEH